MFRDEKHKNTHKNVWGPCAKPATQLQPAFCAAGSSRPKWLKARRPVNKAIEGESESRRRGLKRVDETLGMIASRVNGLQESITRCRNETSDVKTMFSDFRKHYDDCVP